MKNPIQSIVQFLMKDLFDLRRFDSKIYSKFQCYQLLPLYPHPSTLDMFTWNEMADGEGKRAEISRCLDRVPQSNLNASHHDRDMIEYPFHSHFARNAVGS